MTYLLLTTSVMDYIEIESIYGGSDILVVSFRLWAWICGHNTVSLDSYTVM